MIQTNPAKFDEKLFSDIFVQFTFKTRKKNTVFYVSRHAPAKGRSSEGYASLKQVISWPWHVEVIFHGPAIETPTNHHPGDFWRQ